VAAFTLWRAHKVARRGDWFRSSIRVLFGDAAQAVFPLGRFILHHDDRAPDALATKLNTIAPMKTLSVINPHAAAIDVGSEQLHLSIAGDEPVVFGTVTDEVYRLRDYLKAQGVTTVAMEATGVYWLYAYTVLEAAGLEVVVVNGRHVRNLPGRKTDMADCQWLATLHAHGLLRGGFVPPAAGLPAAAGRSHHRRRQPGAENAASIGADEYQVPRRHQRSGRRQRLEGRPGHPQR
jgi:hypothetical protein